MTAADFPTHVLSRLAFGPRSAGLGGARRLDAKEVDGWIEAQLAPAAISDAGCDARVAKLSTVAMSPRELLTRFPGVREDDVSVDPAPPDGTRTFPNPFGDAPLLATDRRRILADLQAEHILRAAYSERQLQEVMTGFWLAYFEGAWGDGPVQTLLPAHIRTILRPNALKSFPVLLRGVMQSPAFLVRFSNADALARALLERHTLGPRGASEADVAEVARCLSGWTAEPNTGTFRLDPAHDNGPKQVFGQSIAAGGGKKDGETVTNLLLSQPGTGRLVATRLVAHFVSGDPPKALVDAVAAEFDRSAGDIPAMLRVIFRSEAFRDPAGFGTRLKTPLELVASSLRFLEAETDAGPALQRWLPRMGPGPFAGEPAPSTLTATQLAERMRFAMSLAAGTIPGTSWNPTFANPNAVLAAAGSLGAATRRAVGGARPATVPRAAGLVLASPELQKR